MGTCMCFYRLQVLLHHCTIATEWQVTFLRVFLFGSLKVSSSIWQKLFWSYFEHPTLRYPKKSVGWRQLKLLRPVGREWDYESSWNPRPSTSGEQLYLLTWISNDSCYCSTSPFSEHDRAFEELVKSPFHFLGMDKAFQAEFSKGYLTVIVH